MGKRRSGPAPLPIPTPWQRPIDEWARSLTAAGRSRSTIATRTDQLRRTARALGPDPWAVTGPQLLDWVGSQDWEAEGRRSMYAGLRSFYRWALLMERIERSPADVLPSVKPSEPCPRPAPESIYRSALMGADDRDQLILRLGAECGLRRAEISQVHRSDLIEDLDGWTLLVHGKGGKQRDVPLPPYLAATVQLACGSSWMLPGNYSGHLSPQWVGKLATRALPGIWTLHTLRHRFASVSYSIDRDLMTLRDLLGHDSVATTQRYVRVVNDAKRNAVLAVSRYGPAA